MEGVIEKKKTNLFIVLSGIFLTNAIIAEVIGVKIFSLEGLLGIKPVSLHVMEDFILDFNLTAGVVIWPIVFITTDIINEYFGRDGVKRISYLTAIFIAYVFAVLWAAIQLPPANFWLEVNKTGEAGTTFNIDYSFFRIFGQGNKIIIASIIAFLVGQLTDAYTFHFIRKYTGKKMIWLRSTGSTLISQLIDSFLVLYVAFYLLADADKQWSLQQVCAVGIMNYIYKFFVAIILTPLLYIAHTIIDNYLGRETSEKVIEDAYEEKK